MAEEQDLLPGLHGMETSPPQANDAPSAGKPNFASAVAQSQSTDAPELDAQGPGSRIDRDQVPPGPTGPGNCTGASGIGHSRGVIPAAAAAAVPDVPAQDPQPKRQEPSASAAPTGCVGAGAATGAPDAGPTSAGDASVTAAARRSPDEGPASAAAAVAAVPAAVPAAGRSGAGAGAGGRSRGDDDGDDEDDGDGGGGYDTASSELTPDAGCRDDSSDEDYRDEDDDYDEDYGRRRRGRLAAQPPAKTAAAAAVGGRNRGRGAAASGSGGAAAATPPPERKKPKWAQPLVRPENDRVRSLRSSQPAPPPKPPPTAADRGKSKSKAKSGRGVGASDGEGAAGAGDDNDKEGGRRGSRGRSRTADGEEGGEASGSSSESGSESESESDSGSGSTTESGSESDADDPASLVREVAEEAARSATAEVAGMWEFAAVLEFLSTFRGVLICQGEAGGGGSEGAGVLYTLLAEGSWSGDMLADEVVRGVGAPGSMLSRLHLGLLQGVTRRSNRLDETTWPAVLSHRIATDYRLLHPGRHPRDYYRPHPPLSTPPPAPAPASPQQQQPAAQQPAGGPGSAGPGGNGPVACGKPPKRTAAVAAAAAVTANVAGRSAATAAAAGGGEKAGGGSGGGGGGSGGKVAAGDPLLPFWAERGHEWREYAGLHPRNRVLALKLLCDMRLEREDVKGAIDAILVPPRGGAAAAAAAAGAKGQRGGVGAGRDARGGAAAAAAGGRGVSGAGGRRRGGGRPPPAPLTAADVRKRPLGHDTTGAALWVVGRLPDLQLRLYREGPPTWPKPKKPRAASPAPEELKGRGKAAGKAAAATIPKKKKSHKEPPPYLQYDLPPEAVPGRWEMLGMGAEGLGGAAEDMRRRSKKQADKDLADKISTELVPVLVDEIERRERREKLEAKLRTALGTDYYCARPRRTRKEVDYSTAAYDKMLHEALRGNRQLLTSTYPTRGDKRSRRSASLASDEQGNDEEGEEDEEEEAGDARTWDEGEEEQEEGKAQHRGEGGRDGAGGLAHGGRGGLAGDRAKRPRLGGSREGSSGDGRGGSEEAGDEEEGLGEGYDDEEEEEEAVREVMDRGSGEPDRDAGEAAGGADAGPEQERQEEGDEAMEEAKEE